MSDYVKWIFVGLRKYWWIILVEIILWSCYVYGLKHNNSIMSILMYLINTAFGVSLPFYFGMKALNKNKDVNTK